MKSQSLCQLWWPVKAGPGNEYRESTGTQTNGSDSGRYAKYSRLPPLVLNLGTLPLFQVFFLPEDFIFFSPVHTLLHPLISLLN